MMWKPWHMKLDFIRKYPITCVWIAWAEGVIIGVLLMYFLM